MNYTGYGYLKLEKQTNGVMLVTMNRPEILNACDVDAVDELCQVWLDIGNDPEVNVALITGAGRGFCAGGDNSKWEPENPDFALRVMDGASRLVYNMINLEKPIVSAINGPAVGEGLAVGLLADISIASDKAVLLDGHTRMGVPPGDHSAIIWPLLCGIARAKYHLMLCDRISGEEAERIGLVSRCVPHDELMPTAQDIAERLSAGSQIALRGAKKIFNNWLKMAGPMFDYSLALEMLSLGKSDNKEGAAAIVEKREPVFPTGIRAPK